MPQVINTNISSLTAQRNLNLSGAGLQSALERLSSGLRINSSKDDAAGLAIATRFTSQIQGLAQAGRNANDGVSLAQVTEGALQEMTTILLRCRELAIQSANGTNSANDRSALQGEVNQLKQEFTRIATTTTFNGVNVLNGDFTGQTFQVGSEANQTISFSVQDARGTAVGANQVSSNNAHGIEGALVKHVYSYANMNFANIAAGANIAAAANNGITATTFTVTHHDSNGVAVNATVATNANDTASEVVTALNAVTGGGLVARGYNEVTLNTMASFTAAADLALTIFDGSTSTSLNIGNATNGTAGLAAVATTINAAASMQALGVYAVYNSTANTTKIISTKGDDIRLGITTAGTINAVGIDGASLAMAFGGTAASVASGIVEIELDQGYAVSVNNSNWIDSAIGLSSSSSIVTNVGSAAAGTDGNNVAAQTLTIGDSAVTVQAGDSAATIATSINLLSGSTGVKASASTVMKMSGLSADGTVSFDLYGDNTTAQGVSATVTTTDLTNLVTAINNVAGTTGVTAALDSSSNAAILLTHATGENIRIESFDHSSATNARLTTAQVAALAVTGNGSGSATITTGTEHYMVVEGNPNTNTGGFTARLYAGGNRDRWNGTVVGGSLVLSADTAFSVSSSIDGTSSNKDSLSLFASAENVSNNSSLTTFSSIDLSTQSGAQTAIAIVDGALSQISSVRAGLGAIQSRFTSVVNNTTTAVNNLSASRSRVLDADFAVETANLSKNQILQQAGIAMLSQANQLPQNVLALLR